MNFHKSAKFNKLSLLLLGAVTFGSTSAYAKLSATAELNHTKDLFTQQALKSQAKKALIKKDKEVKSSIPYAAAAELLDKQTQYISFTLPNGKQITADKKKAYYTDSGSLIWTGKIQAKKKSLIPGSNRITIVKSNGFIRATIKADGQLYKIVPVDNKQVLVEEIDQSQLPDEHGNDVMPLGSSAKMTMGTMSTTQSSTTSIIRILVGYTSEALNQNPGMQALIDLAIAETNQGFADSGVNAQVVLAHSYELNYNESGNHGTDLDRFHAPNDGYMDDVYAIRDQYAADVATILIGDASACGRAREIGASEDTAFMVVKDSCATGYYSFGHELGHLMSARHNPEKDDKTTPYAFGHGFLYTSGGWRTIMSYNSNSCCTRQNFWSDPTRSYQGVVRGTTHTHDNARVLNLTAATIATFRPDLPSSNTPPVAGFNTSITDLFVSFTNTSTDAENNIVSYDWDFGDGNQSNQTSPDHTYASSGTYTVSLTAHDDGGASNTYISQVTVSDSTVNQAPTAGFSFNISGLTVDFIDQSQDLDGQVTQWDWDFGDGTSSTSQNPKHTFSGEGDYWVTLTVTDDDGATNSEQQQVSVSQQTIISSDDFESDMGTWTHSSINDWDWARNEGSTASSSTGPNAGSGGQGYYLYIETSDNRGAYTAGEQAAIETPEYTVTSANLQFDYHMYGSNMGTLSVDVKHNGNWINDIWSVSGQQHSSSSSDYTTANVDLTAYAGTLQVRIRMVADGGYRGDIAIDNVIVSGSQSTPQNQAPEFDFDPITLANAYIDSSYSASIAGNVTDPEGDSVTFSRVSGASWLQVAANGAVSGTPSSSDLGYNSAVVRATDSNGASTEATIEVNVNEAVSSQVLTSLDFEDGINNGWSNASGTVGVWETEAGTTPSSSTGPSDGALTPDLYAYVETSKNYAYDQGDTAELISPVLAGSNRSLTFYYHMYGAEIGSLSVDVYHQGSWQNDVFYVNGQQHSSSSASFTEQVIDLSSFSGDIQVRFRTIAAGGWKGDIAIDDISVEGQP